MCEILAPAGNEISAITAINSGANAIYLGFKQFSARSFADNFDHASFENIVRYAHAFGVKVYVAMNTLIKDSEVEAFISDVLLAWNLGADAIIISDLFLGKFIKRNYPEIVLHLSTQAGVCNSYGASVAKEAGFSRVILARETAFDDVIRISKIIETEVFVQGALCTCFSGQCYLSSFAGGNSGNRGKCKQPCRKKYSFDRIGFEDEAYRLSLSDLCVGENIKKLKEAGVFSFKIEGRMRRPEYVAAAVSYYDKILRGEVNESDFRNLKRTYNRGNYTRGLTFGQDKSLISSAVQGHIGEFVGIIKIINGKYVCQCSEKFCSGDGFKILRGGKEVGGALFNENVKGGFILSSNARLKSGDKAFITTDAALNAKLLNKSLKINISLKIKLVSCKKPSISVNGYEYFGEHELSEAKTSPLSAYDIKNCFNKTGKFPFVVNYDEIECGNVFMPTAGLNALRRDVYKKYYDMISGSGNKKYRLNHTIPEPKSKKSSATAAITTNLNGLCVDIGILKPYSYETVAEDLYNDFKSKKYLYLPPYLTGVEVEKIKNIVKRFDGIYCDGIYGFALAKELNKPLFAGVGLNISNSVAVSECNSEYILLSKELTLKEANALSSGNTFYLTSGNVKVMDLIYCPFEKRCFECDKREIYTLTDENNRRFPVRRYTVGGCRFEVYNCANLVCEQPRCGRVADLSVVDNKIKILNAFVSSKDMNKYFKNRTRGHSVSPVN